MEHLLKTISDTSSCGEYLKGNRTVYRGLRNQFNMAQSSFRQLLETPDATADEELLDQNVNNWKLLSSQCEDILISTSKDVEVFCWFITAQMFTSSPLDNSAKALQAFAEVVKTFWSELQPVLPDNKLKATGDAGRLKEITEFRIRPLLQLVGETENSGLLYMPLQLQGLVGEIDFSRYAHAERNGQLAELKTEAVKTFASDRQTVIDTVLSLGSILESLVEVESFIAEECQKAGTQSVSFRFIKKNVESLLNAIRYLVGDQLKPWPLDKEQAPDPSVETSASEGEVMESSVQQTQPVSGVATVQVMTSGAIASRDHAFNELRKIADYFLETEPHSPVYMLIERAIRWGYLPLPELLQELVGDNANVMGRITNLAGLESTEKTAIPQAAASQQSYASSASDQKQVMQSVQTESGSSGSNDQVTSNDSSSSSESEGGISSFEW